MSLIALTLCITANRENVSSATIIQWHTHADWIISQLLGVLHASCEKSNQSHSGTKLSVNTHRDEVCLMSEIKQASIIFPLPITKMFVQTLCLWNLNWSKLSVSEISCATCYFVVSLVCLVASLSPSSLKVLLREEGPIAASSTISKVSSSSEAWIHRSRWDRKTTRLNSSHLVISYAVFCLKKKKTQLLNVVITRIIILLHLSSSITISVLHTPKF